MNFFVPDGASHMIFVREWKKGACSHNRAENGRSLVKLYKDVESLNKPHFHENFCVGILEFSFLLVYRIIRLHF
jgi:hypothetical protein